MGVEIMYMISDPLPNAARNTSVNSRNNPQSGQTRAALGARTRIFHFNQIW